MERYSMQWEKSCRDADNSFGPAVPVVCRGGFDFTLLFEQAILDLLPATLFICAVAFRIKRLTNTKTFNGWTCLLIAKMVRLSPCLVAYLMEAHIARLRRLYTFLLNLLF